MLVRDLNAATQPRRRVVSKGWESTRLLLKDDQMGFSFHITTIYAGAELPMHYQNHLESVYCISGEGSIEDTATGEVHEIKPGVMYALDKHDKHILRGKTEMKMACVFNHVFVTGRIAANEQSLSEFVDQGGCEMQVLKAFKNAGYRVDSSGRPWRPLTIDLRVNERLCIGPFEEGEREISLYHNC